MDVIYKPTYHSNKNIIIKMVDITLKQVIYSLMTLITGAGIVTIFPQLPDSAVDLFDSHLGRIIVLIMLLLQAGQPIYVSVVMAAIFYLTIVLLRRLEKTKQMQVLQQQATLQQQQEAQVQQAQEASGADL